MRVQAALKVFLWQRRKGAKMLLHAEYLVQSIDGDYAHLIRTDQQDENSEPKLVARALLPEEIREGSRLLYEMMQYTLLE